MSEKILLGFEVGSGEPVYLPLHHTAFTGMTGISGKTTANEAVSVRSGVRTLTFLTKRGEKAFRHSKFVPLFFKEKHDWRYVESLIEAELTEDQRFNRSWIIHVCRGAKSLRDVWNKVKEELPKARKDSLSQRVYTCLNAYFEIIIPSIEKYDLSDKLQIGKEPGSYVMDLIGMPEAVQAVFIRSALEEILDNEHDVWPTIPEAWKFIGATHTPVTDIAIRIIKQGFAVNILLHIDSQDIASINSKIRGQIDNWILGRQKYEHEIERTLKAIPLPKQQKPKVEQIMTLKLGHFIAACRDWTKTIYVLPADVPENVGRKVALGELTPEHVRDEFLLRSHKEDEDLLYKEKYEETKEKLDKLEKEFARQVERLSDLKAEEKVKKVKEEIGKELLKDYIEKDQHTKIVDELLAEHRKELENLQPLKEFRDAFLKILPELPAIEPKHDASPMNMAEIDARINQRLQALPEVKVIKVDVDRAILDKIKTDFQEGTLEKISALPDIAKRAARYIYEKQIVGTGDLHYVLYHKEARTRALSALHMNVTKPLEVAGLVRFDKKKSEVSWAMEELLLSRFKDVLDENDLESMRKYLLSFIV